MSSWWPFGGRSEKSAIDQALESSSTGGLVEWLVGPTPRTDAAHKYARVVIEIWYGGSAPDTTPIKRPPMPVKTLAVTLNQEAAKTGSAGVGWFFIAFVAAFFAFGSGEWGFWAYIAVVASIITLACLVAVVVVVPMTAEAARTYDEQLEAAQSARRRAARRKKELEKLSEKLGVTDIGTLRSITEKPEGRLAMSAANVAGDIEESLAWRSSLLDQHHTRIDLMREVADLTESAYAVSKLRAANGPAPTGVLADDPDVMAIHQRDLERLDMRLKNAALRLQEFVAYRDHVRLLDPVIEKRNWLEAKGSQDAVEQFTAAASDELAAHEIARASAELDSRTTAALEFLLEDTKRLLRDS